MSLDRLPASCPTCGSKTTLRRASIAGAFTCVTVSNAQGTFEGCGAVWRLRKRTPTPPACIACTAGRAAADNGSAAPSLDVYAFAFVLGFAEALHQFALAGGSARFRHRLCPEHTRDLEMNVKGMQERDGTDGSKAPPC